MRKTNPMLAGVALLVAAACSGSVVDDSPAGATPATPMLPVGIGTPVAPAEEMPQPVATPQPVAGAEPVAAPQPVAGAEPVAAPPADPAVYHATVTPAQAQEYLSRLAPNVAARVLSAEERTSINQQGGNAIPAIVEGWTKEPGFARATRLFLEETLGVSGSSPEVDFDLPGNLANHLVENDLPWAEIITADYCINGDGQKDECDTGAPYTAGLLTTRAYLISRQSRFNLTRASTLMKNFACRGYPMEPDLQPPVEKLTLIPMFQAQTPEEQTEAEAANGFGNGFGCYTCHGQFSSHAQLFVKYDREGLYQEDADGVQNPDEELGVAKDGLMASHFLDPALAQSEAAQMFGQNIENLAEAAAIIADNPLFVSCTAERFMDYVLGLPRGAQDYDRQLGDNVVLRSTAERPKPSLAGIVTALLTEPAVIKSMLSIGGEPQ